MATDHTVRVIALGIGTVNSLLSGTYNLKKNVALSLYPASSACNDGPAPVATATVPTGTTTGSNGYYWAALTGGQVCITPNNPVTVAAKADGSGFQMTSGANNMIVAKNPATATSTYTDLSLVQTQRASGSPCINTVASYEAANLAVEDCPTTKDDTYPLKLAEPTQIAAADGVLKNDITSYGALPGPERKRETSITLTVTTNPAHGTVTLNNDGSFLYTPGGAVQPDSFKYKIATSPVGEGCPATVTLTVNHPPVANNDIMVQKNVAAGATSVSYPSSVSVLNNDLDPDSGDTLTADLITQGLFGTVNLASDGSFTYIWGVNFAGTDSFTYKANDGKVQSAAAATVTFSVNRPPTAIADTPAKVNALLGATSYTFTYNLLDNDLDPDAGDKAKLQATIAENAQHGTVTLLPAGTFTFTWDQTFTGSDLFSYTASDGSATSNQAMVNILVNRAPTAVNDQVTAVAVAVGDKSASFTFNVLANDVDNDTGDKASLKATVGTNAQHGTVTLQQGGTFSFTWDQTFTGSDSFTYTAVDQSGSVSNVAAVSFSVNRPPVAADDAVPKVTVVAGATSSTFNNFNVMANDVDNDAGDQAKLKATIGANAKHGTVTLQQAGTFSFMWDQTFTGTDSFTYTVSDGVTTSNAATVTLIVNRPPVASSDTVPVLMNHAATSASFTCNLLGNDADPDPGDLLTALLVSQPAHGHVDLSSNGASFTFSSWDSGFTGSDSFTYVAVDSAGAQSNTVSVQFSMNLAPVAVDDITPTVTVASTATSASFGSPFSVLKNDNDPGNVPAGAQFTPTMVTNAKFGKVVLQPSGTFTFSDWSRSFTGTDSFTYVISDGYLQSNTATVTINVLINHVPSDADDFYTLATNVQGAVFQVASPGVLANAQDPDVPTKQMLSAVPLSNVATAFGVVNLKADGSFTYTNAADVPVGARDSFTYVVTDGTETSHAVTVTINSWICRRWRRPLTWP
eukprot:TRINITY_DN505_c0_g1_i3.p1 TRINITY_DN505_c0_g1~~TRINITY_DN505_c0_g1_i3.p1  ORF type:complete len:1045 (-),score=233.27 TRINITY_DN505_c0_g1_i3:462-3371(-)